MELPQIDFADRAAVFDHVTRHLIGQGACSETEDGDCLYRGPAGTACAIGCLLTDEEAAYGDAPVGDGKFGVDIIALMSEFPSVRQRLGALPRSMLKDLQEVHDDRAPADWPEELAGLRRRWVG